MLSCRQFMTIAVALMLSACNEPKPPAPLEQPAKLVTITIAADGTIAFNGETVAKEDLQARLVAIKQAGSTVILSPDRHTSFAAVREVINAAIEHDLIDKMGVIGGT